MIPPATQWRPTKDWAARQVLHSFDFAHACGRLEGEERRGEGGTAVKEVRQIAPQIAAVMGVPHTVRSAVWPEKESLWCDVSDGSGGVVQIGASVMLGIRGK